MYIVFHCRLFPLSPSSSPTDTLTAASQQFGHGSRTCIGKNISILEMGKFLPQILRDVDVEWASPEPEWKLHAAWFWVQSGMVAKFTWRQKKAESTVSNS